jgi:hypothetical protein
MSKQLARVDMVRQVCFQIKNTVPKMSRLVPLIRSLRLRRRWHLFTSSSNPPSPLSCSEIYPQHATCSNFPVFLKLMPRLSPLLSSVRP